jgi:meso-butanediol dehydrogenase / (S,S)-butanediol dehydrogenase / diacetyl reductase
LTPTVLITGGGTGIGAAVARRMVADGWSVCIVGRRAEPLERLASETGALALVGDVGVEAQAARVVAECLGRFGRLDALVISSGAGATGTVGEQTLERWNRVLATNLTGAFLICREAIEPLSQTGGAIVTVASVAGLRADPESAAYCASKAGLIMLTQCIALDYGPRGVRANCVCPGWIRTEMADGAMDELARDYAIGREEAYALAAAETPARRPGTVEEAAEAIVWLTSPAASYVNGAVLTVDGGTSIVDAGTLAFAPHRRAASRGSSDTGGDSE